MRIKQNEDHDKYGYDAYADPFTTSKKPLAPTGISAKPIN